MAKLVGNTLQFWFGAREYPVDSVDYGVDFSELDTTDTSTPADATDTILNRAKRQIKVTATLAEALGGEVATGTAVAGTTYLVSKGTITEGALTYPVGTIFTSAGTGTLSTDNRVKPLGVKLIGKNIACTLTSSVPVTSLKYSEEYGEYDTTDSGSTGDSTEWVTGRAKRTGSVELIMTAADADKITTSPASQAAVFTFGAGLTLTGTVILKKKSSVSNAKGDVVKTSYDMNWIGSVVSTLADVLTPAVSTATIIVWKPGTSTNKQVSFNAIVVGTTIEADVNSLVKVTYTLDVVGAPTYAVAN